MPNAHDRGTSGGGGADVAARTPEVQAAVATAATPARNRHGSSANLLQDPPTPIIRPTPMPSVSFTCVSGFPLLLGGV